MLHFRTLWCSGKAIAREKYKGNIMHFISFTARAIRVTGIVLACSCLMPAAHSQPYPDKPIRLVLPYAPGGDADVVGRPLAQRLYEKMGKQVVVDNRGGASGNIGMEIVAKSPPDGYTLVLCLAPQLAVNQTLYSKLPYDPFRDFAPISLLATAAHRTAQDFRPQG